MDLDEDAEVKIPEPQAQPGEKEAGSQRQEGPAPATQREGSTPEVAPGGGPRDASETSLWGSGPGMWRWEVSAGAGGGGEGLVQSEGWRNRSVWRPRSVCGGAGEMHRAARVTMSQDGGGGGTAGHGTSHSGSSQRLLGAGGHCLRGAAGSCPHEGSRDTAVGI